jgi:hypothetical protein
MGAIAQLGVVGDDGMGISAGLLTAYSLFKAMSKLRPLWATLTRRRSDTSRRRALEVLTSGPEGLHRGAHAGARLDEQMRADPAPRCRSVSGWPVSQEVVGEAWIGR